MGLKGDAEAEDDYSEVRAVIIEEEDDEGLGSKFHSTVLKGNLWQDIHRETDREGRGFLLLYDRFIKTRTPVVEVLRENHLEMRVPPWKISRAQP